jgi:Fe-S-cluster containining protein
MTRKEVLAAIRADFNQYAPQIPLFLELSRLIFGEHAVVKHDSRDNHLWLAERDSKMVRLSPLEFGFHLCRTLERSERPLEALASICRRVFRTTVQQGQANRSSEPGLWLFTGMEDFTCRQCGHCCRYLDYYDQLTEADFHSWQAMGRRDILEKVRRVKQVNGTYVYRMWERKTAENSAPACPWLHKIPTQNRWECRIHDARPSVCRQYPGSRKHAEMTGCPGFYAPQP